MKMIKGWLLILFILSGFHLNGAEVCTGFTARFEASSTVVEVGEVVTLEYTGSTCFNNLICFANEFTYSVPGGTVVSGQLVQTNVGFVQDLEVVWNTPGTYTVELGVTTNTDCGLSLNQLVPVTINVSASAIPTMEEWGIIVLFLGMMIVTTLSLKGRMVLLKM